MADRVVADLSFDGSPPPPPGRAGRDGEGRSDDPWLTVELLAHDLLSRLTAIAGFAEVLAAGEEYRLSEAQKDELLASVIASSRRMEAILKDLLDLRRVETGSLRPDYRQSRIAESLQGILDGLDLRQHDVHIDSSIDTATIDPFVFERIAENLIVNAVRHTPRGGSISVRARPRARGGVELIVADDGPGVPADTRTTVFDRFSGRSGPGSAGLGLYLVRRLAELHGGRAWLARTKSGAEFHAVLRNS